MLLSPFTCTEVPAGMLRELTAVMRGVGLTAFGSPPVLVPPPPVPPPPPPPPEPLPLPLSPEGTKPESFVRTTESMLTPSSRIHSLKRCVPALGTLIVTRWPFFILFCQVQEPLSLARPREPREVTSPLSPT